MYELIEEGKARIKLKTSDKVSKSMDVFYNPVMKFNRDVSVLLLKSIPDKELHIADPLAGTGIRSIRFLLELSRKKLKSISINDYSHKSENAIKRNLELNKVSSKRVIIKNEDANLFMLNSKGFDYIDIDPFGTPNPYLDAAVKRISRRGILAITATDTSALSGTYPDACMRKYWSRPMRNELMHEIGLRILIRKVQLIGAQYEKALFPIFSYSKDHYIRIFLRCKKGKKKTDDVLRQHNYYLDSGPMWLGSLWDSKLAEDMARKDTMKEKFLETIRDEAKIKTVGFYDLHTIVKEHKLKGIPRKLGMIENLRSSGYKASETHFSGTGIRSNIELKELLSILRRG
jgi:tRNA (guanine26-N2/guanine27-N2)-dimethyltransferase